MSLRMTNESEYEHNSVWIRTKELEWNNEYERNKCKNESERMRMKGIEWKYENDEWEYKRIDW